jgi:hypothetical protein
MRENGGEGQRAVIGVSGEQAGKELPNITVAALKPKFPLAFFSQFHVAT